MIQTEIYTIREGQKRTMKI